MRLARHESHAALGQAEAVVAGSFAARQTVQFQSAVEFPGQFGLPPLAVQAAGLAGGR